MVVTRLSKTRAQSNSLPNLLKRREQQFYSLARVSQELNQTLDHKVILHLVLNEAIHQTQALDGSIQLVEANELGLDFFEDNPIIRPIENWHEIELDILHKGKSRVVNADDGVDALELLTERFASGLFVPILYQHYPVGFMRLFSNQIGIFDSVSLEFADLLAAQAAIAIGNAQRYQEQMHRSELLRVRADQLNQLFQISQTLLSDQPIRASLERIASGVQQASGFNALILSVLDESAKFLIHTAWLGLSREDSHTMYSKSLPLDALEKQMQERFRISNSYLVRTDRRMLPEKLGRVRHAEGEKTLGGQPWHACDLLLVPLKGTGGEMLGVMFADVPRLQLAPNRAVIEVLEIFASQAALAIQNTRLFAASQTRARELETSLTSLQVSYRELDRVSRDLSEKERQNAELLNHLNDMVQERTAALSLERDRNATLLRITTELSASLDLDSVLTRALQLVNDAIHAKQGSLFLHDPITGKMVYRAALGKVTPLPREGMTIPFNRGEGLVGWVVVNRRPVIISNLNTDTRWVKRPFSEEHRSALAVPLMTNEDVVGAVIFYSEKEAAFSEEQLQLVTAAAHQVGSAINNAELYRLIRDQAERLGSMLRAQRVESSKNRAIIESVADGVVVTDAQGIIILVNRSAEQILRISRNELLNRPARQSIGTYGERGAKWLNVIEQWRLPNQPQTEQFSEHIELEDKRIIAIQVAPVVDEHQEFIGSVSLFRDITREVEVDRLKSEFVATVSHELRTPMTAIKGYTDLMLMGATGSLQEGQKNFLKTIQDNANRLKMLVEDLLDISKIEAGRVSLDLHAISLLPILNSVAQHIKGRMSDKGKFLNIALEVSEDLPKIRGDKMRLVQIFTNLVDNAYTYSPENTTITLRAFAIPQGLQVNIKDEGIGLSPEEKNRIFERFFRGENPLVLSSSGTGLGLNIVQRLVEMHNGKIWVESDGPGLGSTFSVILPIADEKTGKTATLS